MGKKHPYTCPVQNCGKGGTISAILQHVAAVHPWVEMPPIVLRGLIERGEVVIRDGTAGKPLAPLSPRMPTMLAFLLGCCTGTAVALVLFLLLRPQF